MTAAATASTKPSKTDDPNFLGRSVKDGRIHYSSVSQIVMADPSLDGGCLRRYHFAYVVGLKEEKTDAQKGGTDYASSLEQYNKTGVGAVEPVLLAARHLFPRFDPVRPLEVERELSPNIAQAVRLRRDFLRQTAGTRISADQLAAHLAALRQICHLDALGVPLKGAFDFRHERQEYIDEFGALRKEDPRHVVGETGDLKTTSRINDHRSRNGKLYEGHAKPIAEILNHPQMLGYGVAHASERPHLTHVRLSHIYAQTKHGFVGEKRTGLLTVDEVRHRWKTRVEPVMAEMKQAVQESDPNKITPNFHACDAYNRLCFYAEKGRCNRKERSFFEAFEIEPPAAALSLTPPPLPPILPPPLPPEIASGSPSTSLAVASQGAPMSMGLFSSIHDPVPPPAPTPPPLPSDLAPPPLPPGALAFVSCGSPGCGPTCPSCHGKGPAGLPPITPSPRPPSNPLLDAGPLSPEAIAEITDPALRQRAEEHAQLHAAEEARKAAEKAAAKAAAGKSESSRCPGGHQTIRLAMVKPRGNKGICPVCSKELPVKPDETGTATIPGHLREAAAPVPASSSLPPLPASTSAPTPPPLPAFAQMPALPDFAKVPAVAASTSAAPASTAPAVTSPTFIVSQEERDFLVASRLVARGDSQTIIGSLGGVLLQVKKYT